MEPRRLPRDAGCGILDQTMPIRATRHHIGYADSLQLAPLAGPATVAGHGE
jgi:hypothetical protein